MDSIGVTLSYSSRMFLYALDLTNQQTDPVTFCILLVGFSAQHPALIATVDVHAPASPQVSQPCIHLHSHCLCWCRVNIYIIMV